MDYLSNNGGERMCSMATYKRIVVKNRVALTVLHEFMNMMDFPVPELDGFESIRVHHWFTSEGWTKFGAVIEMALKDINQACKGLVDWMVFEQETIMCELDDFQALDFARPETEHPVEHQDLLDEEMCNVSMGIVEPIEWLETIISWARTQKVD